MFIGYLKDLKSLKFEIKIFRDMFLIVFFYYSESIFLGDYNFYFDNEEEINIIKRIYIRFIGYLFIKILLKLY